MARNADRAMLASVCILLIVVLGTVQAGPPADSYKMNGLYRFFHPPTSNSTTTQANSHGSTTQSTTKSGTGVVTTTTSPGGQTTSQSGNSHTYTGGGWEVAVISPLGAFAWYFLASVVVGLCVAMTVLLLRREKPRVFDLKTIMQEMEGERSAFVGSWSRRLRNAALLRYYLLMAEVCSKVGIDDLPEETPREFIGRASSELDIAGNESSRFADVVDRAHYGVELTDTEVHDASGFMDAFLTTIRSRVFNG